MRSVRDTVLLDELAAIAATIAPGECRGVPRPGSQGGGAAGVERVTRADPQFDRPRLAAPGGGRLKGPSCRRSRPSPVWTRRSSAGCRGWGSATSSSARRWGLDLRRLGRQRAGRVRPLRGRGPARAPGHPRPSDSTRARRRPSWTGSSWPGCRPPARSGRSGSAAAPIAAIDELPRTAAGSGTGGLFPARGPLPMLSGWSQTPPRIFPPCTGRCSIASPTRGGRRTSRGAKGPGRGDRHLLEVLGRPGPAAPPEAAATQLPGRQRPARGRTSLLPPLDDARLSDAASGACRAPST